MDERRLPQYAVAACGALRRAVEESNGDREGIPVERARAVLAGDDSTVTDADVEQVLDLLRNRGEIYLVEDVLRLTDTEEFDRRYGESDDNASSDPTR
jgi:hypothetical protein